MAGVLDVLSGLSTAAGQGFGGYAQDEQLKVKQALEQAKAAQEAERNRVLNLVGIAGIDPKVQGAIAGARAGATAPIEVKKAIDIATGVAPVDVKKALDIHAGEAPIDVKKATDIATAEIPIKATEAENAAAATERHAPPIAVANKDGSQTLVRRADAINQQKAQTAGQGALAAPMAAKVGQFGEMLKKAHDLTQLTDNLNVGVGNSATRDLAERGLHIPLVGTVPGTKGIGNAMMSHAPEYAQYQAALSPFILAAAHALSGARINQDQVEQIRKSIELAPGDFNNKNVRAQKEKNLIDLINSIGGSLPADAIGAQEGQMDEASLAALEGRGYKRIGKSGGAAIDHSKLSDEEFAKQYKAGAFGKPPG